MALEVLTFACHISVLVRVQFGSCLLLFQRKLVEVDIAAHYRSEIAITSLARGMSVRRRRSATNFQENPVVPTVRQHAPVDVSPKWPLLASPQLLAKVRTISSGNAGQNRGF